MGWLMMRRLRCALRIVDEIRRIGKIGFAVPYARHGACTFLIRKGCFTAMLKTEARSRHDLTKGMKISQLKMLPEQRCAYHWWSIYAAIMPTTCCMNGIRKIGFAMVNQKGSFAVAADSIFHSQPMDVVSRGTTAWSKGSSIK